ncbi:hypothetical protein M9H77_21387 [Catharanthus roseus]|uniref:Uncharacterized protein n=1 Tax=Catharanthus roseus TaxID=4058 RepID=A0ACC0AMK5_CATRO|nr:hypothetical protein M9H77_21387 [Catharanthus roseus]
MTTICYGLRSTSSTILNTTNASGSRVFGAGPVTPTSSAAATISIRIQHFHIIIWCLLSVSERSKEEMNILIGKSVQFSEDLALVRHYRQELCSQVQSQKPFLQEVKKCQIPAGAGV